MASKEKYSVADMAWTRGYASALASIVAKQGSNTAIEEALSEGGLDSVKILRDHCCSSWDIEQLKPIVLKTSREFRKYKNRAVATLMKGKAPRGK